MKVEAGPLSLGSEKRYQIAACVSAIATIIRNRNSENSRTFQCGFCRFPQQKAPVHILQAGHAENESALSMKIWLVPHQAVSRSPHERAHREKSPSPWQAQ